MTEPDAFLFQDPLQQGATSEVLRHEVRKEKVGSARFWDIGICCHNTHDPVTNFMGVKKQSIGSFFVFVFVWLTWIQYTERGFWATICSEVTVLPGLQLCSKGSFSTFQTVAEAAVSHPIPTTRPDKQCSNTWRPSLGPESLNCQHFYKYIPFSFLFKTASFSFMF